MIKLDVWLTFSSGKKVPCGEILCETPDFRGRIEGAFRYSDNFLDHPHCFPLDPVSLPLKTDVFECTRPSGVFSVFEDSLPDDWGRRLLVQKAGLPRDRQTIPGLLAALGGQGLGALSYFEKEPTLTEQPFAEVMDLDILLEAAARYESGRSIKDRELRMLMNAGSSPGGARPKALVKDRDASLWIAKFPSIKDSFSVVPIEAATMSLAKKAGLDVPRFSMIKAGKKEVLLVERFDVSNQGGRRHMISFQTLLKADGWYVAGYSDLMGILQKHSSQPEMDIPALYRQMVFNAFIGNTDDHLKNFTILHDDQKGFHLSPAYDLLPDINHNREHVLGFEHSHFFPGVQTLTRMGKKAGVSKPERIVERAGQCVAGWKNEFVNFGVPRDEIDRLAPGIEKRLN